MATGEAFTQWLEQHPAAGQSGNRTVELTLAYSVQPGSQPPWTSGSDTRTYEVVGYDELGIIVKAANEPQFNITIFYPWASVHKIE